MLKTICFYLLLASTIVATATTVTILHDGKDNQYDFLVKTLNWSANKSAYPHSGPAEQLQQSDVILICDEYPSFSDTKLQQIRQFLLSGGVVFATGDNAIQLSRLTPPGENAGELQIAQPVHYPAHSQLIWPDRVNMRAALLNYPDPVTDFGAAIYNPAAWSPKHLDRYGFSSAGAVWNRLAWNEFDQPILLERDFGRGLLIACAVPVWDTMLYDVRFWAPLLRNALTMTREKSHPSPQLTEWLRLRSSPIISDGNALLFHEVPFVPLAICHVASNSQWAGQPWYRERQQAKTLALKPWRQQIDEVAAAGFNVISFTLPFVNNPEEMIAYCHTKGIGVMPDTWSQLPLPAVENPAIFAWNIIDEPDLANTDPKEVNDACRATRTADPHHPLFVNVGVAMFDRYAEGCDFIGTDIYPVPIGPLSEIGLRTQQAYRQSGHKPVVPFIQIYDLHRKRLPGIDEVRFMAYDTLRNGARGLCFYGYMPETGTYASETPLWNDLAALNAELTADAPAISGHYISPERCRSYFELISTRPTVASGMFVSTDGKFWLLIITNSGDEEAEVEWRPTSVIPNANEECFVMKPWELKVERFRL